MKLSPEDAYTLSIIALWPDGSENEVLLEGLEGDVKQVALGLMNRVPPKNAAIAESVKTLKAWAVARRKPELAFAA